MWALAMTELASLENNSFLRFAGQFGSIIDITPGSLPSYIFPTACAKDEINPRAGSLSLSPRSFIIPASVPESTTRVQYGAVRWSDARSPDTIMRLLSPETKAPVRSILSRQSVADQRVYELLGPITIAARRAAPEPRLLEVILLYARYERVSVLRSQSFILF